MLFCGALYDFGRCLATVEKCQWDVSITFWSPDCQVSRLIFCHYISWNGSVLDLIVFHISSKVYTVCVSHIIKSVSKVYLFVLKVQVMVALVPVRLTCFSSTVVWQFVCVYQGSQTAWRLVLFLHLILQNFPDCKPPWSAVIVRNKSINWTICQLESECVSIMHKLCCSWTLIKRGAHRKNMKYHPPLHISTPSQNIYIFVLENVCFPWQKKHTHYFFSKFWIVRMA